GLRPGEKLYEEKLMAEEGLKKTRNELIHIGCPIPFEVETFLKELETLMDMAYINADNIREKVAEIVKTYHPAGEHGSEKKGEVYERLLGEEKKIEETA
ncbi:MAG: polysaccharide biosynthesis protein, partial [Anaerobutyricum hallii]